MTLGGIETMGGIDWDSVKWISKALVLVGLSVVYAVWIKTKIKEDYHIIKKYYRWAHAECLTFYVTSCGSQESQFVWPLCKGFIYFTTDYSLMTIKNTAARHSYPSWDQWKKGSTFWDETGESIMLLLGAFGVMNIFRGWGLDVLPFNVWSVVLALWFMFVVAVGAIALVKILMWFKLQAIDWSAEELIQMKLEDDRQELWESSEAEELAVLSPARPRRRM